MSPIESHAHCRIIPNCHCSGENKMPKSLNSLLLCFIGLGWRIASKIFLLACSYATHATPPLDSYSLVQKRKNYFFPGHWLSINGEGKTSDDYPSSNKSVDVCIRVADRYRLDSQNLNLITPVLVNIAPINLQYSRRKLRNFFFSFQLLLWLLFCWFSQI